MSLDRSLRSSTALSQHRNVLKRPERIAKLTEQSRFDAAQDEPIHLPKVANRKVVTGKKSAKKGPGEAEEAAAATPAAAPAAKGAAKGGKK